MGLIDRVRTRLRPSTDADDADDAAGRSPVGLSALAEHGAQVRRAGGDPGHEDAARADGDGHHDAPAEDESGVTPSSPAQAEAMADRLPGGHATTPTEVPRAGWVQIAKRGWKEAGADNVPLLGAGVAFYAFLSIVPAITALVLLYGLVFNPADVTQQVHSLGPAVPAAARTLLVGQLQGLTSKSSGGLGLGLVASVALALWSASNGAGHLISAVNTAYDEQETRGFVRRKALALLLTVGAVLFVVVALFLIAALPSVLDALGLSGVARFGVQVVRWALLLGLVVVALAVVYRLAPDRDAPKLRWVSVGAGVATVLWLVASIGFTVYANVVDYGSSYGPLAGVVVLLMWLWLTAYAVLLGAEINAEAEQQTARDTTTGPDQPMGERGATKADTLPRGTPAG